MPCMVALCQAVRPWHPHHAETERVGFPPIRHSFARRYIERGVFVVVGTAHHAAPRACGGVFPSSAILVPVASGL